MAPRKKKQAAGSQEPEMKDKCVWTLDNENKLIDFIEVNKSRGGDGANFDQTFWNEVAVHLAGSTSRLRATFSIVDKVANHSGMAWDNNCGADITPESEMVWADIIKATPNAKSYKTKGWLPYDKLKNILPSNAKGKNTYHPLHSSTTSLASTSATAAGMSFEEVEIREKVAVLDEIENGSNNLGAEDVLMPPPPSPFDTALQPPFAPSTPGTSSAAGKCKANGDDSMRTLVRPPDSLKSKGAGSVLGKLIKSACANMPQAFQQMGSDIRDLSTSFDHAAVVLQECASHTVDPIPLHKQKVIIQLQKEEGLEDHEVVAVIKHFQNDIVITDSYLAIEKDSIHRLFLSDYLK
ncbi:hypothetical protein DFH29DRAFT_871630 [Suillus ampliporus]|nr:hypothetical protein DFH29DRAFT_871630 [Suillus ampliporus]